MINKKLSIYLLALILAYAAPIFSEEGHDHQETQIETEHEENHEDEKDHESHDDHGDEEDHDEHSDHADEKGEHDEESKVHLSSEQLLAAGIVVNTLTTQNVSSEISAPGEIRLNAYATSQVTPRIQAQVLQRHANMGDHVSQGMPLVTLSSVSVAEVQGELLIAGKEWQRVRKLGKKVVSDKRYLEAQIAYQQSQAKLAAYGMTEAQIKKLVNQRNITRANGRFELLATQDGTVINDDFVLGQMVEPGDVLFQITDESKLWVEVRIKPEYITTIRTGAVARIRVEDAWIKGKVIQVHHALDEITRTLAVRLEIANPQDNLHPGQFVMANIQSTGSNQQALLLPQDAVLRSPDGDWQVFVEEEPGEYEPKEVDVIRQISGQVVIEGLEPGVRVVTSGAFFVQSEMAKSGFDVHNH